MKRTRLALGIRVIPIGAAILLAGCGDSSGDSSTGPKQTQPANILVSPSSHSLDAIGGTVQYSATVYDGQGRTINGASVSWVSTNEAVATISSTGLATAVATGSTTVVASSSPAAGNASLTVAAAEISIVTTSLYPGAVGVAYADTLEATGAVSPTWSVTEGSLPDGLSLSSSAGTITGTPTAAGSSTLTIQLEGNGRTLTRQFTQVIASGDLGVTFRDDQFILIPAGSFTMGNDDGNDDEKPAHTVNITKPFFLQKTEVTQHQWASVMGANPSYFVGCGPVCPVESISWNQVREFINALNAADPGKNYRLPSEAEWEYAARAGTTGDYGGTGNLADMGWYDANSVGRTQFVALKQANDWGVYDMHGNVYEWVNDWYDADYYSNTPADDPTGPNEGFYKVVRGGGATSPAEFCRSHRRRSYFLDRGTGDWGFRLVRDPPS